jgi:hypothetical protein
MMKIKLTENRLRKLLTDIIKECVDEASYPSSWNIDEFKALTSFAARLNYCKEKLIALASGSGRYVFGIDNETVLKLAKNKKGIAQNEAEYNFSQDGYNDGIIANVEDCDENFLWIEMEKLKTCTPNRFKAAVGVDIETFASCLRYFEGEMTSNGRNGWFRKPDMYEEVRNNEFFNRVIDIMQAFDMPSGDLGRVSSYGVCNDGTLKICDAGLSSSVYQTYYS